MVSLTFLEEQQNGRRLCDCGGCCWLIIPRLPTPCTNGKVKSFTQSLRHEIDGGAAPLNTPPLSRLRICRLMHRQLPGGSDKIDVQHHRNHLLVLDKKKQRAFGALPSSGTRRAILPNYFPKRLKGRIVGKSAAYRKPAPFARICDSANIETSVNQNAAINPKSPSLAADVLNASEVAEEVETLSEQKQDFLEETSTTENDSIDRLETPCEEPPKTPEEVELEPLGDCKQEEPENQHEVDEPPRGTPESRSAEQENIVRPSSPEHSPSLEEPSEEVSGENGIVAATTYSPKAEAKEAVVRLGAVATLKENVKEYCTIQLQIRLWLSMLQERLEELEQDTQSTKENGSPSLAAAQIDESESSAKEDCEHSNREGTNENGCAKKDPISSSEEATIKTDGATEEEQPINENGIPLANGVQEDKAPGSPTHTLCTPVKEQERKDNDSRRLSYSLLETSKSDILDPSYTCDIKLEPLENRKSSFVDSLLNKFNLSPPVKPSSGCPSLSDGGNDGDSGGPTRRCLRDRKKIAARPRYIEVPEEPRKVRVSKVFGELHKSLNIDLECTNSNSSTEFYGFDEGEVVKLDKPSLPGLLPTPIVKKSQPFAPFLSYGTSIDVSNDDSCYGPETRSDLFREEGRISFGSLPPRLECPQRPDNMVRPRTVAQKRILLQKNDNDLRYRMMDNESKIFHFLKKRTENITVKLDFERIKQLQDQPIPFTRDTWRALSWVRTQENRFYFQTLCIDNRTIKLYGCVGDHPFQRLTPKPTFSSPVTASGGSRIHYIPSCRCPEFPEALTLDLPPQLKQQRKPADDETAKNICRPKLLPHVQFPPVGDYRTHRSYPHTRPGPLSSKCLQTEPAEEEEDPYLGPREIFHMPPVELEVFPKLNRPLDGYVKPFLKLILPHQGITETWARFAVSTLRPPTTLGASRATSEKEGEAGAATPVGDELQQQQLVEERSFVFQLPYENNQRRMLIRRRLIARPGTSVSTVDIDSGRFEKLMEEKLTFRKRIDDAPPADVDEDERICADVLSGMTDSVAIALAEDVFQKDDPDLDYDSKDVKPLVKCSLVAKASANVPVPHTPSPAPGSPAVLPLKVEVPKDGSSGKDQPSQSPSPVGAAESSKTNDPAKLKLLREMKRLNATIIEGPPSQPEAPRKQQRCDARYCALGCICDILHGSQAGTIARVLRSNHCAKNECVFGCTCGYEQKKAINCTQKENGYDLQCDDTALFSADMKHLHEEVTERLAKEERQFTSTVIVTDNAAVVVRNAESEARRQKKMPKKYNDFYNEKSVQCLLNGGGVAVETMGTLAKEPPAHVKALSPADRMRHAHVVLNRLPELATLEPFCMVHELYRCFCGGTATQGKPFSFTDETCIPAAPSKGGTVAAGTSKPIKVSTTVEPAASVAPVAEVATIPIDTRRKRLYSFEKLHSEPSSGGGGGGEQQHRTAIKSAAKSTAATRRRERESSEDSYIPASEKKSSKAKRAKMSSEKIVQRRASVAVRQDSVVAARAGLPPRRASIAVRAKVAAQNAALFDDIPLPPPPPPPKPSSTATQKTARRSEPMLPPPPLPELSSNVQYTVVSQPSKNAAGKATGISNIIIKRIPPPPSSGDTTPPAIPKRATAPPAPPSSSGAATSQKVQKGTEVTVSQQTKPEAAASSSSNVAAAAANNKQHRRMTVGELKKLMLEEHKCSPKEGQTEAKSRKSGGGGPLSKICHIDLVDTEENIDNATHLNNLTDGTKKLVICGNKRTFVEVDDIVNGRPAGRFVPYADRTTYIVQIPQTKQDQQEERISSSSGGAANVAKRLNATSSKPTTPSPAVPSVTSASNVAAITSGRFQQLVTQTDRQLVSLMRHINELLSRAQLNINPAKRGIMYVCRWRVFLRAFVLSQIDVLDVVLKNGLELTLVTGNADQSWRLPPETVQTVTSARRSTFQTFTAGHESTRRRPSILLQMLIQRLDNVKTSQLALVLYGNEKHWNFCGFIKIGPGRPYANNGNILLEPSTQANETIKARLKEYYQKAVEQEKLLNQGTNGKRPSPSTDEVTIPLEVTAQSNLEIAPIAIQPTATLGTMLTLLANALLKSGTAPPKEATTHHQYNRWLRLGITSDFSDMYIPSLKYSASYSRIMSTIANANKESKPICLKIPAPPQDGDGIKEVLPSTPRLASIPGQKACVFLGPFLTTQTKIDVILCQMVDGKLYTREEFQRRNGIKVHGKPKTIGCWIDTNKAKYVPIEAIRPIEKQQQQLPTLETNDVLSRNGSSTLNGTIGTTTTTPQRSLLKRNLNTTTGQQQLRRQPQEENGTDSDDCVVVLDDDDNGDVDDDNDELPLGVAPSPDHRALEQQQHRLINGNDRKEVVVRNKSLSVPSPNDRLRHLIEKTMEEKRTLATLKQATTKATTGGKRLPGASVESVTRKRKSIENDDEDDDDKPLARVKQMKNDNPSQNTMTNNSSSKSSSSSITSVPRRKDVLRKSVSVSTPTPESFKAPQITKKLVRNAPIATNGGGGAAKTTEDFPHVPMPMARRVMRARAMSVATRADVAAFGSGQLVVKPIENLISKAAPPLEPPVTNDVVCLEDDDNEDDSGGGGGGQPIPLPRVSNGGRHAEVAPSLATAAAAVVTTGGKTTSTFLNHEQVAMLASRLDLSKSGKQAGYTYNPTTRVLTMKKSLVNSLSKENPQLMENITSAATNAKATTASTRSSAPVPVITTTTIKTALSPASARPTEKTPPLKSSTPSSAKCVRSQSVAPGAASSSTTSTTTTSSSITSARRMSLPRMKVVPRVSVTPSSLSTTTNDESISGSEAGASSDQNGGSSSCRMVGPVNVKCLTPAMEAVLLTKPHKRGVLRSKVEGLGLVEVVRLKREVIIRMRELTGQKQFVSVSNLEDAVTLLNKFIQWNTYAFKPYNLAIQWEFVEWSTPLAPNEQLTNLINLRCVVTRYGLIDMSKTEQLNEVEQSLPALHEELMLMKLAIACFPKPIYEEQRCYEDVTKIFEKATRTIDQLKRTEKRLLAQKMKIRDLVQQKQARLKSLGSKVVVPAANDSSRPPPSLQESESNQESVIVIDDD